MFETNNTELITKAELLNAMLLMCSEQIPEAKKQLLQIIKTNPHNIDAMLEYVELCDNTPEPDDELKRIENLARALNSDHPHLFLIDLARKYKKQEILKGDKLFNKQFSDKRLNARLICQHSLFCDLAQKIKKRESISGKKNYQTHHGLIS